MDYNTVRNQLMLSEYGRNVQRMVEYVVGIEDEAKRLEQGQAVIEVMAQLNPQVKIHVEDYKHKLWDHMHMMSDFKLVVNSPYPAPDREEVFAKPQKMTYPQSEFKHRHYGKGVEQMIAKAIEEQDEEKRQAFTQVIGNYMKLVHANWNNETVNNDVIRDDLFRMSGGKLKLSEEVNLDLLGKPNTRQNFTHRENTGRRKGGGRGQQKRGGGHKPRRKN